MASGYSDLSEICKDGRNFAAYPKPPKINLLDEKGRRESVIERQLNTVITRPNLNYDQQQVGFNQQVYSPQSHQTQLTSQYSNITSNSHVIPKIEVGFSQNQQPTSDYSVYHHQEPRTSNQVKTITTTTRTSTSFNDPSISYQQLEADLALKEAKLKREMAYLNQHMNPWSRPKQIREPRKEPPAKSERNDRRWVREFPSSPSSRPTSRASSSASTTEADLMEKAAKLLKDVDELTKKPLNNQKILIESGAAPGGSSRGEIHQQSVSDVHTAVIKVPRNEVNNKSPLPFSYDNFSTLGVRGNIASVGAAEPESPYPPIFPMIKRTPSPSTRNR